MRPYLEDVLIRNAKIGGDLKYASNSQAITANFTIPDSSGTVQKIDATSTNRNVTLPTPADGLYKIVINASSGAAVLTVKDVAGPTTIATLSQNSVGLFWCVGTSWYGMAIAEDITGAELETLHGVTAGTVSASKAVVVDSNKHIDTLGIAASGLKIGVSGSETTVTATGAELNTVAGVTLGTAIASKVVTTDSSINVSALNVVGLARIDLDSTTGTFSSNAVTITKWSAILTTESLTTAHTASQALVITKTGVAAGDLAFVSLVGGTNTQGVPMFKAVCTTDTVTITLQNGAIATNAFNGTFIFALFIMKA